MLTQKIFEFARKSVAFGSLFHILKKSILWAVSHLKTKHLTILRKFAMPAELAPNDDLADFCDSFTRVPFSSIVLELHRGPTKLHPSLILSCT